MLPLQDGRSEARGDNPREMIALATRSHQEFVPPPPRTTPTEIPPVQAPPPLTTTVPYVQTRAASPPAQALAAALLPGHTKQVSFAAVNAQTDAPAVAVAPIQVFNAIAEQMPWQLKPRPTAPEAGLRGVNVNVTPTGAKTPPPT